MHPRGGGVRRGGGSAPKGVCVWRGSASKWGDGEGEQEREVERESDRERERRRENGGGGV